MYVRGPWGCIEPAARPLQGQGAAWWSSEAMTRVRLLCDTCHFHHRRFCCHNRMVSSSQHRTASACLLTEAGVTLFTVLKSFRTNVALHHCPVPGSQTCWNVQCVAHLSWCQLIDEGKCKSVVENLFLYLNSAPFLQVSRHVKWHQPITAHSASTLREEKKTEHGGGNSFWLNI